MRGRLLLRRQLRGSASVLAVLGLIIAATSFLAAAAPRALNGAYDAALATTLREAPDAQRDLVVNATAGTYRGDIPSELAMFNEAVPAAVAEAMGPDLASVATTRTGAAQSKEYEVRDLASAHALSEVPTQLSLRLQEGYEANVDFLTGTAPAGADAVEVPPAVRNSLKLPANYELDLLPRLDISISRQTANMLGLDVGRELLLLPGGSNRAISPLAVRITGIYTPRDPLSSFWSAERRMLGALPVPTPDGGVGVSAVGLVAPAEHAELISHTMFESLAYSWRYTLDTAGLRADRVGPLLTDLHALDHLQTPRAAGAFALSTRTGIGDLLGEYQRQRVVTQNVVAVGLATLLAVAVAAAALTARTLVSRRWAALALARARGASALQLVMLTAWQTAQVMLPCAFVGALAAGSVAGRSSPVSWQLALAVAAAPLLLVATATYHDHRATNVARPFTSPRAWSPRRLTGEALLVVLAVGSVVQVNRGTFRTDHFDPYLVAAPALLGLAAAAVALRVYRYPLRLAALAGRRRRGAVAFVGLATAARARIASALPLVVLLLSLTLSLFAGAVQSSLARGQSESAWRTLGADATVTGSGLTPDVVDALSHVRGVKAVLPAYVDTAARVVVGGRNSEPVTVVAVDPVRYAQLLRATPAHFTTPDAMAPPAEPGASYPALASRRLPTTTPNRPTVDLAFAGTTVRVTQAGVVDGLLDSSPSATIVLVPREALLAVPGAPAEPNTVLVFGSGVRASALSAASPGGQARVLTVGQVRAQIAGAPLSKLIRVAFTTAVGTCAALSVLTVVLWLAVTASTRNRVLSLLRTLGLSPGEARRIVALELLPVAATALVVGAALGMALPRLVGRSVDLTPFVGGTGSAALTANTAGALTVVGAFVAVVGLAVIGATTLNRHLRPGSAVRLGDGP